MRAVRRSPLFRIALLSLAVLFAHTVRANKQPITPAAASCPGKVAAAQPDPEKKLSPAGKRTIRSGRLVSSHNLFGGSLGVTSAHPASLLSLHGVDHTAITRRTAYVAPQRQPFDLRI